MEYIIWDQDSWKINELQVLILLRKVDSIASLCKIRRGYPKDWIPPFSCNFIRIPLPHHFRDSILNGSDLAFWAFSFLLAPFFFEVWMLSYEACNSIFCIMMPQGLRQIAFRSVWSEWNIMASRSPGACLSNKEEQSLPDINIADGCMLLLLADFARIGSYKRKLKTPLNQ